MAAIKRKYTPKSYSTAKRAKTSTSTIAGPLPRSAQVFKPETKAQDFRGGPVTTSTLAGRVFLADIDQDGSFTGRNGNWIQIKGLEMNLSLKHPQANAGQFIRLMVVQDLQQQSDTLTTMSQVLAGGYLSHYNAVNGGRFKVYHDQLLSLDNVGTKAYSLKKSFKLDIPVAYNGTIGTNVRKNGLYFFYVGSDAVDTADMSFDFRIKYYDH